MNFLVTGATGFIGSKLATQLIARGDAVHYFARKQNPKLPAACIFHPWQIETEPDFHGMPNLDAVIHLVGETVNQRWTEEAKKRIYASRVQSTRNLVKGLAGLQNKLPVLVNASAIGYYGDRGDEVLTEDKPPGHDFLAKVCIDWEREAGHGTEFGMRVVPIRFAAVLGRESGAFPLMKRPAQLGLGARFGDGNQWMSWIHIQDLVDMILFAVSNEQIGGVMNGASPEPVTNRAFTKALGDALHRPAFLAVPKFVLKAALGEMSSFLVSSLRVVPARAEHAGFSFQFATLAAALRDLVRS
jgi:uncharacterized protein (TIGR01777 family)